MMPVTLLTNIAVAKITAAAGSNSQVMITHIALGDGLGAAYDPSEAQTNLRRELARRPIESRAMIGGNSWHIRCEFPPDTPAFLRREIGFFDADGDLIAVNAGLDMQPLQTGAVSYLLTHILQFSRIAEGLIIVDAPDDELFDFAIATITAQAATDLTLFNIQEKLA
jgi:hypothetical protein